MILDDKDQFIREALREIAKDLGESDPYPPPAEPLSFGQKLIQKGYQNTANPFQVICPHGKIVTDVFLAAYGTCGCNQ
jgi:hypothetical protein